MSCSYDLVAAKTSACDNYFGTASKSGILMAGYVCARTSSGSAWTCFCDVVGCALARSNFPIIVICRSCTVLPDAVQTALQSTRGFMTVDTKGGHPAMDYPEHLRTYQGFLRGSAVLIVFVALLLVGMLVTLV